jgi:hypothetical protein
MNKTPLRDRLQQAKDAKLHGPHCFDGKLLVCGWPELHRAPR